MHLIIKAFGLRFRFRGMTHCAWQRHHATKRTTTVQSKNRPNRINRKIESIVSPLLPHLLQFPDPGLKIRIIHPRCQTGLVQALGAFVVGGLGEARFADFFRIQRGEGRDLPGVAAGDEPGLAARLLVEQVF
jgi:hypothetical protein